METTNHRAQLVYNSMKYYYFYTRPDYRLVWDFIQCPTDVLDTIPVRIPQMDSLLLAMHALLEEYTGQLEEFDYWDFADKLLTLDCTDQADKQLLKEALQYNQEIVLGTMHRGMVLREDYFKLSVSLLFFLREEMKDKHMGCPLTKEIQELLPREPVALN